MANKPTAASALATTTSDTLQIEEVAWAEGTTREVHPQLRDMLAKSWANRIEKGNTVQTPAFKIVVKNAEDQKLRTQQLRDAGNALNIGVGIRAIDNNGKTELHFRAQRRRGTGPNATTTKQ